MCVSHTAFSTEGHAEIGAQLLPKWIKEKYLTLFSSFAKKWNVWNDTLKLIICSDGLKSLYFHSILHGLIIAGSP